MQAYDSESREFEDVPDEARRIVYKGKVRGALLFTCIISRKIFCCLFIVLKISLFFMSSSHDPVIRMFHCLFIALKISLFSTSSRQSRHALHSLDVLGQISCFIFFQGKGKGKGKGKATRDVEETSQDEKPAEDKKETKKLRTLDVFAGCGGSTFRLKHSHGKNHREKNAKISSLCVIYTTKYFASVAKWIAQGFCCQHCLKYCRNQEQQ